MTESRNRPRDGVHYRACNLCEAICGLEIRVEDGRITSIRGDEEDPFSRGHICPKAVALQDIQDDPDRLRHPQRRTASGWQRIGWDEAFDEVAEGLRAVQRAHGRDAIGVYLGNPNVHNYGSLIYGPPLLRDLRSKNTFSATSVDQLPHHLAAHAMFGHMLMIPVPDVDRTDFLLMLGANPAASNGSLMTAPGIKRRLKELRGRGGRLVVVDPRRTETAKLADRHLFVRPGTDAFLLLALLQVIFAEGLESPGALEAISTPLEPLRQAAADFPPERVVAATGIAAEEIRRLAGEFAAAPSAVAYGRMGVSTQEFGGLCQWLLVALNVVTGNLDRPGGGMFTRPAVDPLPRTGRGHLGRWKSRVRGLPEFGSELPASALAEEMLTPGEGQIRALLTVAGNPVLSTPNGARLDQALEGLDFMVSIDIYVNETTRHADIILPPTAALEHDHYDLVFHSLAVRNTAKYSPAVFPPAEDTRHDWQILSELRRRLGSGSVKERANLWLWERLGPRRALDFGLRFGPYGSGLNPFGGGLSLAKVEGSVHGMDLGPLEPCLPDRLFHKDKKIRLAPEIYLQDMPRLERRLEELESASGGVDGHGGFLLTGRRQVRSNNSWMHNYPRLMRGEDRCTLLVHPDDARRLGLESGGRAAVTSRAGRIEAPVEVSDEVMPGVVSLPHGWGHGRSGVRLRTAREHPGVSVNDVTDDQLVDALSGNAAVNGVPVAVEAVAVVPVTEEAVAEEGVAETHQEAV